MLKYQDKVINLLDTFTLSSLPRTICVIGEEGSGKHTYTQIISNKFNLPIEDITEKISLETVEDILVSVVKKLYLIDFDKVTIKDQNILLKLLEEPSMNATIVVLTSNPVTVLETVLNRCYRIELDKYTKDQLKEFVKDESLLDLVNTPGQALNLSNQDVAGMRALASKIISCIAGAGFANCLVLPNKLYYKDVEEGKFEVDSFVKILLNEVHNKVVDDSKFIEVYKLTTELSRDLKIIRVDKQKVFENYLLHLKNEMMKIGC